MRANVARLTGFGVSVWYMCSNMRSLPHAALVLALFAAQAHAEGAPAAPKASKASKVQPEAPLAPKATRISQAELPAGLKPLDTLVHALRWSDRAGDNVAAFSRTLDEKHGNARLQIELWSGKDGHGGVVRTLKDAELHCEFDLYAEFIEAALGVTDLDGDGLGELTFAYRTTCTSDVSPFTLKLFLLEQREKYAVRGYTVVDAGEGEKLGGDKTLDPALRKQPAFARHLEAVWKRIVALHPWT
jgi:hypothetical protein